MTISYCSTLSILALAGCDVMKSPDRIHELEGRVDELSVTLSAVTGKAVGARAKKDDGEHGDKPKEEAAETKPAHAADKDPPSEPEHRAKAAVSLDDHPVSDKITAAEIAALPDKKPHDKPHWGYDDKHGPQSWASLDPAWVTCGEGKAQSPIDIEPKASKTSPIGFHYKPTGASVVDNGHTLEVSFQPGSSIDIDGHAYELVQFHVHTPSEHAIAGEKYPLEVHLVHKDAAGKLAVIGVLYDRGSESKPLDAVWAKWPRAVGVEDKLGKPFDPSTLLPEVRTVYRYDGSLTTPPCSEGVVWNVMRRSMTDSKQHLALLAQHYKLNARPVQPVGSRKVQ